MRLVTSLQVFLIAAPLAFAQTGQPPKIRNSSLIGITIMHRPTGHCTNGSERAFLIDVSKQPFKLIPVLPELTSQLGYPLILDAEKQTLFSNSESHDPTVLPNSNSDFYEWIDNRRGIMVLRGEFSTDAAQKTYSHAMGGWPKECHKHDEGTRHDVDGITDVITWDAYAFDLATNRKTSLTEAFRSGSDGRRYNEGFQPLKSETGSQVGWIFKSYPPFGMWTIDMSGQNATPITDVGVHGCNVSPPPLDPILVCQGTGPDTKSVKVGKRNGFILGGDYWAALWAPDGSGFLSRDDPTEHSIVYYAVDRTKPTPVVAKPVSMVPKGWTPIICCTGDYDPKALDEKRYELVPNANRGWPWGSALYKWSPDSQWLYYSATSVETEKGTVIIRVSRRNPTDFEKLTDKVVLKGKRMPILDARYPEPSPDGKYLAFLSTGTDPQGEPVACLTPDDYKVEWNVQLYTIRLADKKLSQITHLGCNTMPSAGVHWLSGLGTITKQNARHAN